ncbi:MAG: hypothetical protein ACXWQO_10680 [Bdellovibrionota bacterium]
MKTITLLFLALFSIPSFAAPAAPKTTFTTVFYDDGGIVYVGLKHGDTNPESQVISFPFPPMGTRTKIPLPEEVAHRDVVGLIPDREKLFVLTNGGGDTTDGPMLHLFDQKKNEWKKIGKVNCPVFTKVRLSSTQMTFSCETGAMVGRRNHKHQQIVQKSLSFGKERIFRSGTWRFPEFLLRYKGNTLLLEGDAPSWDKLRLKSPEEERLIKAEDLFDLPDPTPAEVPAAVPPTPASS